MNRDAQTHALLHNQAHLSQGLWTEIDKIRNGRIGVELEPLKNEFIALLNEGISTNVITNVANLARLETNVK